MNGTILLVEDNDSLRLLFREGLSLAGLTVHEVATGEAALDWLADHRPSVAILDIGLPGMSGLAVMDHLRASERHRACGIIIITADQYTYEQHPTPSADAVLVKPLHLADLVATTRRLAVTPGPDA